MFLLTGDILRAEVKQNTPLGQQAQAYMAAGKLGREMPLFFLLVPSSPLAGERGVAEVTMSRDVIIPVLPALVYSPFA